MEVHEIIFVDASVQPGIWVEFVSGFEQEVVRHSMRKKRKKVLVLNEEAGSGFGMVWLFRPRQFAGLCMAFLGFSSNSYLAGYLSIWNFINKGSVACPLALQIPHHSNLAEKITALSRVGAYA